MLLLRQQQHREEALAPGNNVLQVLCGVCVFRHIAWPAYQTYSKGLLTHSIRQLVRQTSTLRLVELATGVSAVRSTAVHAAVL